ncbi:reprolysin-like metallopeptidase [uncultured Nonlabens sp.]|uniref:zinc-dependent metalloprotease n=1 Tax=uncultured Nonlabens sp. TaxID=859306 RepID=UPI0030D9C94E|tara:strand:- start:4111 stop:8301 length:4191 start_codon:yes stop_codon:yes gene_type:complete
MPSKALIALSIFLFPIVLFAQKNNFWEMTDINDLKKEGVIEYSASVENPIYFKLDKALMSAYLSNAPDRYNQSKSKVLISIPNPDGKFDTFRIFAAQTMAPELAKKYSEIKSYVGYNISNKSHAARITITPQGFYATTVGSEHRTTLINPYLKNSNQYIVFSSKDAVLKEKAAFECQVEGLSKNTIEKPSSANAKFINDGKLRKFRFAVATTVEYSDYQILQAGLTAGSTDAAARNAVQAAIVVSIDRVNQIFERDLGITLELIANNDQLISLGSAASDPYTNSSLSTLLDENKTNIDTVIGLTNYDIGHILCTTGGGLAQTPAACLSGKARGATGLSTPVGEYFNISILSHELGHQFGANHTQNNNVNRNNNTAVEPGSGSTIMSYAGVAAPNVQGQSDAMFHYISINEISNRFVGSTGFCAQEVTIANQAPLVQALPNYTIPKSTPFALEAVASDANGDALTYSWDQIDNEIAPMPPVSTSSGGPSFRTFLPSNSPIRYFPAMSTLLTNSYSNTWEVLPSVARSLNFGVIVRDNNALGGQVSHQTTTLSVDDTAGPFRVTSQSATGDAWIANSTKTVTWDVANTDDPAGINAQNVDILLSTDAGQTYTTLLIGNTPNDGSQDITVPDVVSTSARLMVKASDNIFFDINSESFSIGAELELDYCNARATQVAPNATYTNINRVVFNTINNGPTGHSGYSDFTNLYTPVSRGNSYPIEVSENSGPYSSDRLLVWIDFNKDGIFADPGEKVLDTSGNNFGGSFGTFGGNINIPTNASLGKTRMRIRMNNTVGTSNITPCGNSTLGEVEDYTVVIYDDYVYYDNAWTPTNPSGVSTATDNVLVVNGSPTLTGTTTSNTLTILPFKTLNIEGVLDVNGDIDNDGQLIFKSNATSTGQLDTFTGTISGTGNVTVERFIPAGDNNKRAFRLLTSTVSSSNSIKMNWQEGENNTSATNLNPNPGYGTQISGSITGANGFDATGSGNPSLFTFDPIGQTWGAINNTDMNTLVAGAPYLLMVRGDRSIDLTSNTSTPTNTTLRATGTLRTGSVNATPSMAAGAGGFSFIGNPYQAVVDYGSLTTTNLTDFIYVWDASIAGSNGRGGYVTVEVSSNSIVPGPSSSDATKYIAPGQAFFVQNKAAGNGSITFEEAHKATSQAQVSIFNTNTDFYINSRLYKSIDLQNAAMESDAIGLRFSDNFTTLGSDEDATKLYNLDENYAISNNGHKAIDKQDLPVDGHVVELYTAGYTTTNYSLSFDLGNQPQDVRVRLNDNHLNTQTQLINNTLYDFTVDSAIPESIATNRFSLHFEYTTLGIGDHNFGEGFSLYPNPTNTGQFTINAVGLAGQFVAVKIYNMLGQDVFTSNSTVAPNDEIKVNASSLSNGMYMVELDQGGRKMTTKLLIK